MTIKNLVGAISSPGYPRHMNQAHLTWTFKPVKAYAVVEFEEIYLYRYDGG